MAEPQNAGSCRKDGHSVLSANEGYISTKIAAEEGWGSLACPWRLDAQQGQQVDISVIDFNPSDKQNCEPIGYIYDVDSKKNITMCKSNQRNSVIHKSSGKSVMIQLTANGLASDETAEGILVFYKSKQDSVVLDSLMIYAVIWR